MNAARAEKPPKRRAAISQPIAAGTTLFFSVGLVSSLAVIAILVRRGDATWIAYGISLLIALGFGLALMSSPPTRVNASLVVVSIAVSLYVAEALLATEVIGTGATEPALEHRTWLEVLAARRAQGAEAWPPGIPANFVGSDGLPDDADPLYPLAGVSGVEIIYCNDEHAWQSYVSDEHGFNNPPGLHRIGRAHVVVVGDSFALGTCVPPGEDTAGRLRAMGIDALNLGMGGSGPLIELATLTEYGLPLRPKHVVWFYYEGNDLENLKSERSSPFLRRYLNDRGFSQNLRGRQIEIDERLKAWMNKMERSAARSRKLATLKRVVKLGHLRSRLGLGVGRPVPDDLLRQVLRETDHRVKQAGASFTIAYLPSPWRYRRNRDNDGNFAYRDLVRRWMREDGFDIVDFGEVISRHGEPLAFFGLDGHFNPQGYRRLAEVLAARW